MTSKYNPGVHRFANFVVAWTILLFVAGALVTSNDAALSVPDWPKSFGTWFPTLSMLEGGAFFEHSHRVIAGILGVLVLVLVVILIWMKDDRRWLRWFGVVAIGGIAVQAVLGGEVVRQLLHYWLPVLHACFGQIMFGALLGIAVFTSKWWMTERPQLSDSGVAVDSCGDDRECRSDLLAGGAGSGIPASGNSNLAPHGWARLLFWER